MTRKLFVAGNWKMTTSLEEAPALAGAMVEKIGSVEAVDVAVFPPFPYLAPVAKVLAGSEIALGAQDVFYENNGAYTGEVSAAMLKDVGCTYAICGHSERRHVIGETDEMINRKVLKCIGDSLKPILCVGELLTERQADETIEVVSRQIHLGLESVSLADMVGVTIAYEPVWAIGTGVTATPDQAQEVHAVIRRILGEIYDDATARSVRIQYGGSVKPDNAGELLCQPDIDGALVGGASLKADDFAKIIQAKTN
ncbi:MAG: triose-phosphate isomerase [Phycisphaerae bacterium]|nr:triose-phosphate isomerase [Phycisphaerae bacterium]